MNNTENGTPKQYGELLGTMLAHSGMNLIENRFYWKYIANSSSAQARNEFLNVYTGFMISAVALSFRSNLGHRDCHQEITNAMIERIATVYSFTYGGSTQEIVNSISIDFSCIKGDASNRNTIIMGLVSAISMQEGLFVQKNNLDAVMQFASYVKDIMSPVLDTVERTTIYKTNREYTVYWRS